MDLGLDQKVDTQSVHVKQAIESVGWLSQWPCCCSGVIQYCSSAIFKLPNHAPTHALCLWICNRGHQFPGLWRVQIDTFQVFAGHACSCCGGATVFPASIWPGVSREPSHGEGRCCGAGEVRALEVFFPVWHDTLIGWFSKSSPYVDWFIALIKECLHGMVWMAIMPPQPVRHNLWCFFCHWAKKSMAAWNSASVFAKCSFPSTLSCVWGLVWAPAATPLKDDIVSGWFCVGCVQVMLSLGRKKTWWWWYHSMSTEAWCWYHSMPTEAWWWWNHSMSTLGDHYWSSHWFSNKQHYLSHVHQSLVVVSFPTHWSLVVMVSFHVHWSLVVVSFHVHRSLVMVSF